MHQLARLISHFIPVLILATPAWNQVTPAIDPVELPELQIWGRKDDFRQQDTPTADGGEYLSRLSGLSGSRMGGHGIDPAIRGQMQDRNTVLLDGAAIHGGCPNRMDPASSYAPIEFYDSVRVFKGPQTLSYGPGGTGGIVLFERSVKRFDEQKNVLLSLDSGYADNADSWFASLDAAAGTEDWQARLFGTVRDAGDYEDGDGQTVRSAYHQAGLSLIGAWTPSELSAVEVGLERTKATDVLFAGAPMDSPLSESDILRLRFRHQPDEGAFQTIEFDMGYAAVTHDMDNYKLRVNTMMWMDVTSDTAVWTGRLNTRIRAGPGEIQAGLNLRDTAADSVRFAGPAGTPPTMINSFMWPDVHRSEVGLFGEYRWNPDEASNLTVGLRLDHFDASADKAELDPPGMMMSPDQLYTAYYGSADQRGAVDGFGAIIRYERNLGSDGLKGYIAAQRSLRDADPTERFIAANNSLPMMRWIGNPGLELETHHLAEVGLVYQTSAWLLAGSVYGDWVANFIARDRAHGQPGIEQSDNASIYRNIDASLIGFELEMAHQITKQVGVNANLSYVEGTNTGDDLSLAQIPPVEGSVGLDYLTERFRIAAIVRFAGEQNRVDDDPMTGSGLDVGKTPAWATLDLEGHYQLNRWVVLRGGVSNLLNETYAIHLNRSNVFDSTPVRINEPGRTLWMALDLTY